MENVWTVTQIRLGEGGGGGGGYHWGGGVGEPRTGIIYYRSIDLLRLSITKCAVCPGSLVTVAFDNIYRRSSTLGASSSSLSAVCCGTRACVPSAKSAMVV